MTYENPSAIRVNGSRNQIGMIIVNPALVAGIGAFCVVAAYQLGGWTVETLLSALALRGPRMWFCTWLARLIAPNAALYVLISNRCRFQDFRIILAGIIVGLLACLLFDGLCGRVLAGVFGLERGRALCLAQLTLVPFAASASSAALSRAWQFRTSTSNLDERVGFSPRNGPPD
jgi:hypothetical protein